MNLAMKSAIPEHLDVNSSCREIGGYLQRIEKCCIPGENSQMTKQNAMFLSFVGKEAYAIIKILVYPNTPISLKYAKVKSVLSVHFRPVNFEPAEKTHSHNSTWKPDQHLRSFNLQLKTRGAKFNFGGQLEIQWQDYFVGGITHPEKPTFQSARAGCEKF